tara:strand:+ start:2965 stop:3117 length:153 start_codon:yes stop_codon:yes gene_type:complete
MIPYYAAGALIDLFGKLVNIIIVLGLLVLFGVPIIYVTLDDEEILNKLEK